MQTAVDPLMVAVGNGFTITEYMNALVGEQPLAAGMIEKLTLTGVGLEFVIAWWISPVPEV